MLVEHAFNYLIPPRLQFRHEEGVVEPAVNGGRVDIELSGSFSSPSSPRPAAHGDGLFVAAALAASFGLHRPLLLGRAPQRETTDERFRRKLAEQGGDPGKALTA